MPITYLRIDKGSSNYDRKKIELLTLKDGEINNLRDEISSTKENNKTGEQSDNNIDIYNTDPGTTTLVI